VKEESIRISPLRIYPGSKINGVTLLVSGEQDRQVVWAAHLKPRGNPIKQSLDQRRAVRKARRSRQTRVVLPVLRIEKALVEGSSPLIQSCVDNVFHLTKRLCRLAAVTFIAVKTIHFDTQKMRDAEITGVAYP